MEVQKWSKSHGNREQRKVQVIFCDELLMAFPGIKAHANHFHLIFLQIADSIPARFGDDYIPQDWTKVNKPLFSALYLEKIAVSLAIVAFFSSRGLFQRVLGTVRLFSEGTELEL